MMETFNDGYTQMLEAKMNDWGLEKIYEIEEDLSKLEENQQEIIEYLKDIRCSMPLGLMLRRYLCGKFKKAYDEERKEYVFELSNHTECRVRDYHREDYNIETDDLAVYVDVFLDINNKWSPSMLFSKAEAKRLLRMTTSCTRSKLFEISFALHFNHEETAKFLTDCLGEQTFNYRQVEEIICYYCQSHEEVNSYTDFCRIKAEYEKRASVVSAEEQKKENYTTYAQEIVTKYLQTEEQLLNFLVVNTPNFVGYSQTAYDCFVELYEQALKKSKIQTLSNNEYTTNDEANTRNQLKKRVSNINTALELREVTNSEQLARAMFRCIPRASMVKERKGKKLVETDFIHVHNDENMKSSKKTQTTTLPKDVTQNLPLKDRLDDLLKRKKPVDRKALVFLQFYNFSLELDEKETYLQDDYLVFMDETNDMLQRCGMSRMYAANRFENLILMSLCSTHPFEMFEMIVEASFVNEPAYNEE